MIIINISIITDIYYSNNDIYYNNFTLSNSSCASSHFLLVVEDVEQHSTPACPSLFAPLTCRNTLPIVKMKKWGQMVWWEVAPIRSPSGVCCCRAQ